MAKNFLFAIQQARSLSLGDSFERLNRVEVRVVRSQARVLRLGGPRRAAVILTRMGSFWLYPGLALGLMLAWRWRAKQVIEAAALAATLAHVIYPVIKASAARIRPCDAFDEFPCLCTPLDRYSFPSGHSMTAAAVFVPIAIASPSLVVPILIAWALLAWARVAVAHHYPTDLLGGAVLGTAVSLPVSHLILQ